MSYKLHKDEIQEILKEALKYCKSIESDTRALQITMKIVEDSGSPEITVSGLISSILYRSKFKFSEEEFQKIMKG